MLTLNLASTWIEARRAFDIINYLKTEWLPATDTVEQNGGTALSLDSSGVGAEENYDQIAEMLQDWFARNNAWELSAHNTPQPFF